jgi:hypothetical protein
MSLWIDVYSVDPVESNYNYLRNMNDLLHELQEQLVWSNQSDIIDDNRLIFPIPISYLTHTKQKYYLKQREDHLKSFLRRL